MKIEQLKTIILTVLVITSFVLTSSIWTYQPDYEFIEDEKYIQEVSIGQKKALVEVIRPNKIILHKQNEHYGLNNSSIKEIYKEMQAWNLYEFEERDYLFPGNFSPSTNTVEIFFSTELSLHTLRSMLKINDEKINPTTFNRMIISLDTLKRDLEPTIRFISDQKKSVYEAKVSNLSIDKFNERYFSTHYLLQPYKSYKVGEKRFYLPEGSLLMSQLTYSAQKTPVEPFINALFSDPSIVKHNTLEYGGEAYTDGTRALEVLQAQKLFRFINPARSETNKMNASQLITSSVNFMNDHTGWTDDYRLSDIKYSTNQLYYQLFVNGFPVIDPYHLSTIEQVWKGGEIFEYTRPLIDLKFPFEFESKNIALMGSDKVIEIIDTKQITGNVSDIEDIYIGYELFLESTASLIISFKPTWIIDYKNNRWEKVTIPNLDGQGGQ